MTPLLSIIVVSHHSRQKIGACLESLPREIGDRRVEVVLVDNAPGDGTRTFVESAFGEVTVLDPGEDLGLAAAYNLGFDASVGEWVLFLQPDTLCSEGAIEHLLVRMRHEPTIGLISPRLVRTDGGTTMGCRRGRPTKWNGFCQAVGLSQIFPNRAWASGYSLSYRPERGSYDVGAIDGAFMLGRRTDFATWSIPWAPVVFNEELRTHGYALDLCLRVGAAGRRVVYDGKVEVMHLRALEEGLEDERLIGEIFDGRLRVCLAYLAKGAVDRLGWRLVFGIWRRLAIFRASARSKDPGSALI